MDVESKEIQEYFKALDVAISLYPDETIHKFKTFTSFYRFLEAEKNFWEEYQQGNCSTIRSAFYSLFNEVTIFANNFGTPNQNNTTLQNVITNLNSKQFPYINSKSVYGKFIANLYKHGSRQADAAIDILKRTSLGQINDANYFLGAVTSTIFQNDRLINEENLSADRESIKSIKQEYSDSLSKLNENFYSKKHQLEDDFKEFQDSTSQWEKDIQKSTSDLLQKKQDEFEALEKTYVEKIKLSAPTEEWHKLFLNYRIVGIVWCVIASLLTGALIKIMLNVLYNVPPIWLCQEKFAI